jgi:hypothetical protein
LLELRRWLVERLPDGRSTHLLAGGDCDLADLGLSSIEVTELAAEVERALGIRVPAAEMFEFRRFSDVVSALSPAIEKS